MGAIRTFALLLVITGAVVIFVDKTQGAEMPLLVGLFILLVIKPKQYDERALSLKTSAVYVSLIIGYAIKLISSNLYSHQIISWELTQINHFLIFVFALALAIYNARLYSTSH